MKNLHLLQAFLQKPLLSLDELRNSGFGLEEKMFVSLGGGIGSFCWVNSLRVHAVAPTKIAVIAQHHRPYQQFKSYCEHSGLTPQDRLRSDSGARPDNLWGFPGYAVSEFLANLQAGKWLAAAKIAGQIFAEPFGCDFYTPTAGRVYASIDREMARMGWASMLRQGTALFLRKLDDGRLAIFYQEPTNHICVIIANFVHLALGHTLRRPDYLRALTTNMPTDMPIEMAIKMTTNQVLSGYELEEDFFNTVAETGASVVVVGRGIVAARIIERLLPKEPLLARHKIISLLRTPLTERPDSRNLQQAALGAWRLQPFNWPRSTFGGPLMETLQQAPPNERRQLARAWSAATTSPRKAWLRDLKKAQAVNFYRSVYGQIARVEQENGRLTLVITPHSKDEGETLTLQADYLVDCSGLLTKRPTTPSMRIS